MFYSKKGFPVVWFGFVAYFLLSAATSGATSVMSYLIPVGMGVFGLILFRAYVWDMVDEVYDAGDRLVFRKSGIEQVVPLEAIVSIDSVSMQSFERVTVQTQIPGPMGMDLIFGVPAPLNPFSKSPVVKDLIARVDRTKRT